MKPISGGVCAPTGFLAAGSAAGIKRPGSTKKDCALLFSEHDAAIAGTFTTNLMKAPPIAWTEGVCIRGSGRAVFINSGNANACTGSKGLRDAQETAEAIALALDIPVTEVAVLSTGVIGVFLPMDRIQAGVHACIAGLTQQGSADAALAIMTTDTVPKETAFEVDLSQGSVRLGAIAKGSGMIAPNMATMISVITTDAYIEAANLQTMLRECVAHSFNCICVDNDMSTSDAVICLANGQAGLPEIVPGTADYETFQEALRSLCIQMAQWLVRDGEGATKFVEILVEGAPDDEAAKTLARSVAVSQLCKTAFHGEDPNWGRIACALGYAGVPFDTGYLQIALGDVEVVHDGLPVDYREEDAAAIMKQPEYTIRISVGNGSGACTFWTSDLSHAYVSINADYRS